MRTVRLVDVRTHAQARMHAHSTHTVCTRLFLLLGQQSTQLALQLQLRPGGQALLCVHASAACQCHHAGGQRAVQRPHTAASAACGSTHLFLQHRQCLVLVQQLLLLAEQDEPGLRNLATNLRGHGSAGRAGGAWSARMRPCAAPMPMPAAPCSPVLLHAATHLLQLPDPALALFPALLPVLLLLRQQLAGLLVRQGPGWRGWCWCWRGRSSSRR